MNHIAYEYFSRFARLLVLPAALCGALLTCVPCAASAPEKEQCEVWNTTFLGTWADFDISALELRDDLAYIGNGNYLQIIEITQPSSPHLIGQLLMPSTVLDIELEGNYAYLVGDFGGRLLFGAHESSGNFAHQPGYSSRCILSGTRSLQRGTTCGRSARKSGVPGRPDRR